MTPAVPPVIEAAIRKLYGQLWLAWYGEHAKESPATLVITSEDRTSGYRPLLDTVELHVPEGNWSDVLWARSLPSNPASWRSWHCELVHEMLHEWQAKRRPPITEEVRTLALQFARGCDGEPHACGHDETFFAAIVDRAPSMGLTAVDLVRAI